jgi:hypothetical protein
VARRKNSEQQTPEGALLLPEWLADYDDLNNEQTRAWYAARENWFVEHGIADDYRAIRTVIEASKVAYGITGSKAWDRAMRRFNEQVRQER